MLHCVFSDGGSHYPSVNKEDKETASYSIVSKTDSEILLQSETNEGKNGAIHLYVIGPIFFLQNSLLLVFAVEFVLKLVYVYEFLCRLALDLSSLSGGAPGRTRGLKIGSVNSF
ncbi:Guanylate kinase 1 [Zea mays]|uniref:Guanylate kinase 1 n=1 Tax=Zea mays TaxID=4577 RepID=A0A1D6IWV1_MAIZE|nr:Guanylate kinase 1 [Zea mays]